MPAADRTAPTVSKGRVGSGGKGSTMPRLRKMMVATTAAWRRNEARQLIVVVMRPPTNGPAAAPMPPMPLMMPKARARDLRSLKASVARM